VPLTAACETVTLTPPVLVIVSERELLLPTVTLPKLRLVRLAASAPGATPVPDNGMARAGLEALEVIVTLPLALPADEGANVTLKLVLPPAGNVSGVAIPFTLNPVPLIPSCEISTLDVPALVSVTVSDCWAPTVTLPKASLVELGDSCPSATAVPVPVSARSVKGVDASLVMAIFALKVPAALGMNSTPTVVLRPAASVTGRVGEVRTKFWLVIAALLMVIDVLPLFAAVNVVVLLLPTGTLPKLMLEVPKVRLSGVDWLEVWVC
jgi:hypothetical protein